MKILDAPTSYESDMQAIEFIKNCESAFRSDVTAVAQRILSVGGLRLIGLTGPTCAGKTTAASILISELLAAGRRVHLVSVDDFFRDQPHGRSLMNEPDGEKRLDFDSIDALDFPLFRSCLSDLMSGRRAKIPKYDLGAGKRVGFSELYAPDESDVILVEGIQVVYPEISELLHRYTYHSIYIDVGRSMTVGNSVYRPEQIRLLRRLVRDYYFRSSEAAFTFFLWHSVRANEEKNIFPYVSLCESRLDSLMGYEVGMLKPHLETILAHPGSKSEDRARANEILNDIRAVAPLKSEWLPEHALYREFVPVHERNKK